MISLLIFLAKKSRLHKEVDKFNEADSKFDEDAILLLSRIIEDKSFKIVKEIQRIDNEFEIISFSSHVFEPEITFDDEGNTKQLRLLIDLMMEIVDNEQLPLIEPLMLSVEMA